MPIVGSTDIDDHQPANAKDVQALEKKAGNNQLGFNVLKFKYSFLPATYDNFCTVEGRDTDRRRAMCMLPGWQRREVKAQNGIICCTSNVRLITTSLVVSLQ